MSPLHDDIEDLAAERWALGRSTYGDFDPRTDERDLARELREELADSLNYCRMLAQQGRPQRDVESALHDAWESIQ